MKPPAAPPIVIIGVLTLITIFFWIAFEVYRGFSIKPAPAVPTEILSPINPALDESVLNKLQQRVHLSDQEIGNNTVASIASVPNPTTTPAPIETPSPTPISTASASPTASPSATTSPSP